MKRMDYLKRFSAAVVMGIVVVCLMAVGEAEAVLLNLSGQTVAANSEYDEPDGDPIEYPKEAAFDNNHGTRWATGAHRRIGSVLEIRNKGSFMAGTARLGELQAPVRVGVRIGVRPSLSTISAAAFPRSNCSRTATP
ncbi:MAG: hypothetical protein ISS31_07520 [Kiritimatiellae bacterium]|nr:hypothetical protein [Kiritimatiellia bacterium]